MVTSGQTSQEMPLRGVRVIELGSLVAGPYASAMLAQFGAEVIKIEHPSNPDVTRSWKLPNEDQVNNVSAYFSSINYKKKYIWIQGSLLAQGRSKMACPWNQKQNIKKSWSFCFS